MNDPGFALIPPGPITPSHDTAVFDCGQASLNEWLRRRALRNHLEGYTNVSVLASGHRVIGYYGVAATSLAPASVPRAIRGGDAPSPLPALLIGRFAVDREWQRRSIGTLLFRDALRRCIVTADLVGARVVVVRALDERAAAFYRRHDFRSLDDPLTLYQAIARIRAARLDYVKSDG